MPKKATTDEIVNESSEDVVEAKLPQKTKKSKEEPAEEKKVEAAATEPSEVAEQEVVAKEEAPKKKTTTRKKSTTKKKSDEAAEAKATSKRTIVPKHEVGNKSVITLDKDEAPIYLSDEEEEYELAWKEIQNSKNFGEILTATLNDIEPLSGKDGAITEMAICNYKGISIKIPISEMNIVIENRDSKGKNIVISDSSKEYNQQLSKIMSSMQGAEIDFIVTNYSREHNLVVASRKKAMEEKVKTYYIEYHNGERVIQEGSIVQARIIAVSEGTYVRLEVFGVECFTKCSELDCAWISSARNVYHVGEKIFVRIVSVDFSDKKIHIKVEARSLKKPDTLVCKPNSKYLATVTAVAKGTYYLRLKSGANGIAYNYEGEKPYPAVGDEVKLRCTRYDKSNQLCVGTINRVIKRNR